MLLVRFSAPPILPSSCWSTIHRLPPFLSRKNFATPPRLGADGARTAESVPVLGPSQLLHFSARGFRLPSAGGRPSPSACRSALSLPRKVSLREPLSAEFRQAPRFPTQRGTWKLDLRPPGCRRTKHSPRGPAPASPDHQLCSALRSPPATPLASQLRPEARQRTAPA